jgi:transcription initiation factor TFIID subunit TAF12
MNLSNILNSCQSYCPQASRYIKAAISQIYKSVGTNGMQQQQQQPQQQQQQPQQQQQQQTQGASKLRDTTNLFGLNKIQGLGNLPNGYKATPIGDGYFYIDGQNGERWIYNVNNKTIKKS